MLDGNGTCSDCRFFHHEARHSLAAVLIFTIVVDILGNVLVIVSVLRNPKLRNAEIRRGKNVAMVLSALAKRSREERLLPSAWIFSQITAEAVNLYNWKGHNFPLKSGKAMKCNLKCIFALVSGSLNVKIPVYPK
uniref:Uncharacterized protein n=1 Tax=Sphaerodactylus townsendi TaxID=933632 RepID=A0ACB8FX50_9SAUR